ncbi:glycoside hydrolase [Duganella radicis]|uniref:Glycoside hydrolase n=2 Tax=Duganella radicis TaxID=551988 RepID=A0A6L6PEQ7_9BURK|nr:glycoside hydrolase [Duganella radicis]
MEGDWAVSLDRADRGMMEGWFTRPLAAAVPVRGSLPAQPLGDAITVDTQWTAKLFNRQFFIAPEYAAYRAPGKVKVPFFLQPDTHYVGPAWFQREIVIPRHWDGKHAVVSLERPHWETRAWIDGRYLGRDDSLHTPHVYDLGQLSPGKHLLTVRVDNRLIVDIGSDAHGVSDHTQGNWNGIIGNIELSARQPVWIEDLQAYPDIHTRSVTLKGVIGNASTRAGSGRVRLAGGGTVRQVDVSWQPEGGSFEAIVPYPADAGLWDEFSPTLHVVAVRLDDGPEVAVRFGFRELKTSGTQFLLNGRPLFLRGTLECCIFPLTGHPPTDIAEWRRILTIARAFGLNHLRFHSYCPPQAAFDAADEMGFYYQIELCWANGSTTIGDGKPVDAWSMTEAARVLKAYGNHPSFMLMPQGNEPGGKNHPAYLANFVRHFAQRDARRLWTSGAGWPELAENQYHILQQPRIQQWGEELKSRVNGRPPETMIDYRGFIGERKVPVVSHEIGQWCVYPDLRERAQYSGHLKAKNFDIFEDRLRASGLAALAPAFLHASGRLQTLLYKEEIEAALRTPGMGGFQLLDLHDFPGQGTALVGVLNPFWREKGYVGAAEFSRFCGPTVMLARLPKRVFGNDEAPRVQLEVAHSGARPLGTASVYWRLESEQGVLEQGEFQLAGVPQGTGVPLGAITLPLARVERAAKCKLVAGLRSPDLAAPVENDWELWVYPPLPAAAGAVQVVDSVAAALPLLARGDTVLLGLPPAKVRNFERHPVKFGFSTIFWNTLWTEGQGPTTLGVLCDPAHPALAAFPTDAHTNWQWWHVVHRAAALRLDGLPPSLQPLVRVIDDWHTGRSLGLVIEATVGAGRLIVCGFELGEPAGADPVSRQLRHSLAAYAASARFAPQTALTAAMLKSLVA